MTSEDRFPEGARFAFTILDDTDVATVANVRPVYQLLESLGLGATKTVWPVACPEGSRDFSSSETLEDPEYRDFALDLHARGFEIAFHGATMESSPRERTAEGLRRFRETFGAPPRIHANHASNRENLYWGRDRVDDPIVRAAYSRVAGVPRDFFAGHREGTPWFWGDLARENITYLRNLTFSTLDVLALNPGMPYADRRRPFGRYWFSTSDAEDAQGFLRTVTPRALDRLERGGGVCILSTHLGKGYARDGAVRPPVRERLEAVARRQGWFPTVGTLLDWLRDRGGGRELPPAEWRRMQWRWLGDLIQRRAVERLRRRFRRRQGSRAGPS